jgi:hypothetical protein
MSALVALENRLKGIEALLSLAQARANGGGGGVALAASFVWQPNGTAGEGIYITSQSLGAALPKIKGRKVVSVDTSNGAAHLTIAGSPYNLDDVEFVAAIGSALVIITVDAGVTFTSSTINLFLRNVIMETTGGGTVWSPPAEMFLGMDTAAIQCAAGAAFLDGTAATGVDIDAIGSIIGDGTNAVILVEPAGVVGVNLTGSEINNNAIAQSTGPGGTVQAFMDSSSATGPTQGAGVTIDRIYLGLNAAEGFLAATSGAVGSVSVPTSTSITMTRTGAVDVSGFIGGTNSAAATITVQLVRDAAVIATYPPIVLTAAGDWSASLAITDQLTDDTSHTYSIVATPSAGTIDVVGNASKTLSNAFVEARER